MIEQIKTINRNYETKFKEKGSTFIGLAFPTKSEDEANVFLEKIKKQYYDAIHHCYAYKLYDGLFKYSDDGEPNGTAGVRILNAIDHFELTDVILVVVRYFGGVKLGVGPLGKAYYNSAYITLQEAEFIIKKSFNRLIISADFSYLSQIHRLVANYKAIIENTTYDNKSHFNCLIEINSVQQFKREMIEISNGNISIMHTGDLIFI